MDLLLMLSNDFAKPWRLLAEISERWNIVGNFELWIQEAEDEEFSSIIAPNLRVIEKYSFQIGDTPGVMEITSECMNCVADSNACNDYINVALIAPNNVLSDCCRNYREQNIDLIRRLIENGEWFAVQGVEERFVASNNTVIIGDKGGLLEAHLKSHEIDIREADAVLLRSIRCHVPDEYFVVLKAPFNLLVEQDDIDNHPKVRSYRDDGYKKSKKNSRLPSLCRN